MYARCLIPQAIDRELTYRVPEHLESAVMPGSRVEVSVRGQPVNALVTALEPAAPAGFTIQDIRRSLDDGPFYDAPALKFLAWVADYYLASPGLVLRAAWPPATRTVRKREPAAEPASEVVLPDAGIPPAPTAAQRTAIDRIAAAVARPEFAPFLLHGVTGSGKTEVYLRACEATLAAGKGVILLVPEITLAHQIVAWVKVRFPGRTTVLHSRLAGAERGRALAEARTGPRIVVGARSAIFAPVSPLGLIIVDEEHEGTYKQEESAPSYHARDAALMRARLTGCPIVLGSATPSLETYAQVVAGRIANLPLPERIDGTPMPDITVVPIDRQGHSGGIGHALKTALVETVGRKEQALLFLNRRGFAPVLLCVACGATCRCTECSTTLVLHAREGRMKCHWCGAHIPVPSQCPKCSGGPLRAVGAGTERVEADVQEILPQAIIVRMDQDTTRKRTAHGDLLDRFADSDVLVGTQMVAKGLDFPRLALVGVMQADESLLLPDFRAAERTFQLLTQVAGRAGRRDRQGQVIAQAWDPEHPAIVAAARHDYAAFATEELAMRKLLGYPPYGRLLRFRFQGKRRDRVEHVARALAKDLGSRLGAKASVLGPAPAMPAVVARTYRFHLVLKGPDGKVLRSAARAALTAIAVPENRDVRVTADPDPVNVLS